MKLFFLIVVLALVVLVKSDINTPEDSDNISEDTMDNDLSEIGTIINNISKQQYREAVEKYNQIPYSFDTLRDVIIQSYQKLGTKGVELIVDFLEYLPTEKIRGYGILVMELRLTHQTDNPALLTMTYRLQNANEETKQSPSYELTIKSIPEFILSFPLNYTIRVVTKQFQTSFYASDVLVGVDRRQVFAYKNKMSCTTTNCFWTLVPQNNGKYFQLKSGNDELLYAESHKYLYDRERRSVYTKTIDKKSALWQQSLWQFEPLSHSKNFRLKNVYYDEYLYVADGFDFDDNNRRVFLWIPKGCDGGACQFTPGFL